MCFVFRLYGFLLSCFLIIMGFFKKCNRHSTQNVFDMEGLQTDTPIFYKFHYKIQKKEFFGKPFQRKLTNGSLFMQKVH